MFVISTQLYHDRRCVGIYQVHLLNLYVFFGLILLVDIQGIDLQRPSMLFPPEVLQGKHEISCYLQYLEVQRWSIPTFSVVTDAKIVY